MQLRNGEISAQQVVEETLVAIERRNPDLGAFVVVNEARAMRRAAQVDRQLQQRQQGGPIFLGVPTAFKDIDITAFDRTQFGARNFRYLWSPVDSPVPRQMRKGGFVVVGKTATSELAVMPVVETDIHPPCRNPWSLEHSAGGSSGGAASAVAAGLLPIAHASDGGGSIRVPASFCGLFGFKPSVGLLPDWYAAIDPVGMSQVNCVAHTVDDSAAMLDVLLDRSYDPRTPPAESLLRTCRARPDRLRVKWTAASPLVEVDPEIAEVVARTAERLGELGHDVEEASMIDAGVADFLPLFGHVLSRPPVLSNDWLQPATRYVRDQGAGVSREQATAIGLALRARVAEWFGAADLWLTPTCAVLPPRVGAWSGMDGKSAFEQAIPVGAFTALFNAGGQCAASLPLGRSASGLPIGVQLAAPIGRDALLLQACRELLQTSSR